MILAAIVAIAILSGFWFGLARGTYITIDESANMRNFFFFMTGIAIPLSNVVALIARYPLSRPGTISVWKKYRDKKGKLVTRPLVNRADMRDGDFRDLIERIHSANPKIQIDDELLK